MISSILLKDFYRERVSESERERERERERGERKKEKDTNVERDKKQGEREREREREDRFPCDAHFCFLHRLLYEIHIKLVFETKSNGIMFDRDFM